MSGRTQKDPGSARFRLKDILIVVFCLSGAVYSLNLFRLDLFNTVSLQNEQPVGTITIKQNIVQRRVANRVLWDRLAVESPVYLGDLIRVAELSSATLNIDNKQIDINENTLIRIQRSLGEEGLFEIELTEGSLSLSTGTDGGSIMLNLMGRQVEAAPGTILNAAAGTEGMSLQVNEGTVLFIEEEGSREVPSGTMIALNTQGAQRAEPAAVILKPLPNARFLKSTAQPVSIDFSWRRLNLRPDDSLRLEISADRNFSRIIHVIGGLDIFAQAALESGLWHWRLCLADAVLSAGRLTVTEAAGPQLLSPVTDSLYRYNNEFPALRFQWSQIAEASSYIFEASLIPDFINPQITRQTGAVFIVDSSMGPGTWYWRVKPVFPPVYDGSAAYSQVSFFRIEQSGISETLVIELPEPIPEPEPVPQPEPVVEEPEPAEEVIPAEIRLLAPARGATLPGLSALREQTIFSWEYDGEINNARFILSRNSNPLSGRPYLERSNPGRTIRVDRLEEGNWYWTVVAQTADGLSVSAAEPRQLRVLPIPLLPAPDNRLPAAGSRIGIEQLRTQRNIVFRWAAVPGANAYIFTLYEQTRSGRRQIISTAPENRTSWTLDNVSELDRGTFVWQVEALNRGRNNVIEQRGRIGENSFILDVPLPGPVRLEEPGILYGR